MKLPTIYREVSQIGRHGVSPLTMFLLGFSTGLGSAIALIIAMCAVGG